MNLFRSCSLNFIYQPKKNQMTKKNEIGETKKDDPGVNGTLPRAGLPDHEWLRRRVQGRIQGLCPVPASTAVKRLHRLDLEDRLPPRIHTAPDPRRARCPAPNHIHVFFPRCLRRCQLEATELSVPSSYLNISFLSFPFVFLFFFFLSLLWYLPFFSKVK